MSRVKKKFGRSHVAGLPIFTSISKQLAGIPSEFTTFGMAILLQARRTRTGPVNVFRAAEINNHPNFLDLLLVSFVGIRII